MLAVRTGFRPVPLERLPILVPLLPRPVAGSRSIFRLSVRARLSASGRLTRHIAQERATTANPARHVYSYIPGASNNQYKLAAKLESALYTDSGTGDLESTDGGWDVNMYEQGSNVASL